MHKILIFLVALFFSNSTVISTIPASFISSAISRQTSRAYEDKEVFLDVPSVIQETSDYCVAASLTSIFKFWGWEENKTQTQIYQEARLASQTPDTEGGVRVNPNIANYMKAFISDATNQESAYTFSGINITFGISLDDITIFSAYVWNSLSSNVPLMLGMYPERIGHALVLCGYKESPDSPWYDEYGLMDPDDGQIYWLIAQVLHESFKYGFTLIGNNGMPTIKDSLEIDIPSFSNDLNNLPGNNIPVYAGEVQVNITKHTGISDFSYFNTAFSFLAVSTFKSEIKKVNDDPDVLTPFALQTEALPKTDIDYWGTANTIFHAYSEVIGCEIIKTWSSLQVLIERAQNNNLMIYLRFYGGYQITRSSTFTPPISDYELRGRVKISSGPKVLLRRNLQPNFN